MNLFLGIDPGIVNTGWYILDADNDRTGFGDTFTPSKYPDRFSAARGLIQVISSACEKNDLSFKDIQTCYIERYVAYAGKLNANTEPTLLLIGSLTFPLNDRGITILEGRAIDWKPKVCKLLFSRHGFRNPSDKFDKEYSLAAAAEISGIVHKKDHTADACCMAYLAREHFRNNPEFYHAKKVSQQPSN